MRASRREDKPAHAARRPALQPVRALGGAGPIGRGKRFRAATKTIGRSVEMTIEFSYYGRPRRLAQLTHLPTMKIQAP